MKPSLSLASSFGAILFVFSTTLLCAQTPMDWRSGTPWEEPPLVTPSETPGGPPSDAIVLLDGTDLDAWVNPKWELKDGVVTVKPRSGDMVTKEKFGSVQVHLEFATPTEITGKEQGRGNSGLFLMNTYEVQILDSHENPTYFDGQCAGIYKQRPPYVNVCKKPGEWQSYDVFFTRPIFTLKDGKIIDVVRPAYVTVVHNGVLVVNNYAVKGNTYWHRSPDYQAHPDAAPIRLQDHGNPMKFRNIWVRPIPDANFEPQKTERAYYQDAETKEKQKFEKLLKEEKAKWEAERKKKDAEKKASESTKTADAAISSEKKPPKE